MKITSTYVMFVAGGGRDSVLYENDKHFIEAFILVIPFLEGFPMSRFVLDFQ